MVVTASVKNYTLINNMDTSTDWTGETPVQQTGFYKEGASCTGFTVRGNGNNDISDTGTWDLSGNATLHLWLMTVVISELNWVQFYCSDGGNTGYWDILHASDYPGGWTNIATDLSRAVDAGTKPADMSAITTVGFRFSHTGVGKNAENTWIDHVFIGDGIIAYGDDGGGSFDLEDIYLIDSDDTTSGRGWGIMTKPSGVYSMVGDLTIGDNVSTNSCDFQSLSQILVFEERIWNATTNLLRAATYGIYGVGNGTGTTSIMFGDVSGGAGISGCTIKANDSTRPFVITFTDTNVATLGLYANSIDNHALADFMVNSATREILGNSWVNSAYQIQPNTMTFTSNFVIGNTSADGAVLYESTSHNISYTTYINNTNATEFAAANTYGMTGDKFIGGTYDIHFSDTTGNLIINLGGSPKADASPAQVDNDSTGTVTINNTVSVNIYITDSSGTELDGARVYMEVETGGDWPFEVVVTIASTTTTATVTKVTHGLAVNELVKISGCTEPEYNGVWTIVTVPTADTYTYTMDNDPVGSAATGSPVHTYVIIQELSAVSTGLAQNPGQRYISSPIDFTGWARKSTTAPFYKTTPFTGSIENADYTTTVILNPDQ